jgi:hypothetical protein
MPAWLLGVGATLGGVLVKMAAQLVTEAFLKRAIISGLEAAVKRSETEEDDKLLKAAKEAWGVEG